MYPIVGTIGYILPLCGGEKFAKYFRKEKKQKKNTAKIKKKKKYSKKKILIFMSIVKL